MAAALQIIPAGARQVAPGVFQARGRRSGPSKKSHAKKSGGGKHGFFARQWVWFAFALMLGEVAQQTMFRNAPGWMSVPALILYAYGTAKKKPGAINAAYALQGARLLSYFGVTGTVTSLASRAMSGGGFFSPMSMEGGGGGGGGADLVSFDSRTLGNATRNVQDVAAAAKVVASIMA